jgi:hypothetical protein
MLKVLQVEHEPFGWQRDRADDDRLTRQLEIPGKRVRQRTGLLSATACPVGVGKSTASLINGRMRETLSCLSPATIATMDCGRRATWRNNTNLPQCDVVQSTSQDVDARMLAICGLFFPIRDFAPIFGSD